jgi:uncharacterized protein
VKAGQKVWVNVTEVDVKRKRIALSMKGEAAANSGRPAKSKQEDYASQDMNSALAALKNKFKR